MNQECFDVLIYLAATNSGALLSFVAGSVDRGDRRNRRSPEREGLERKAGIHRSFLHRARKLACEKREWGTEGRCS